MASKACILQARVPSKDPQQGPYERPLPPNGQRRGLATWSSSHLHWQLSVMSDSFQPCRTGEICLTLTIIAARYPIIIKHSINYHFLLVDGVFGF